MRILDSARRTLASVDASGGTAADLGVKNGLERIEPVQLQAMIALHAKCIGEASPTQRNSLAYGAYLFSKGIMKDHPDWQLAR